MRLWKRELLVDQVRKQTRKQTRKQSVRKPVSSPRVQNGGCVNLRMSKPSLNILAA